MCKKRVADIVVEILINNGISHAFSVTGGGSMHLNNAFSLVQDKLETIYNHHEQACAMAAEGYAKLVGKPAVVCVSSGPAGLNTLNGIQGAWVDNVPMIILAGHPRYDTTVESCGLNLRYRGVQENDIVSQAKNITKYAKMVLDPLSIKAELQYAIDVAMSGRRGPVLLSIPLNVQGSIVDTDELYSYYEKPSVPTISDRDIDCLYEMLRMAKRPCILTGSAIRTSNLMTEYREFLSRTKIPIVGGAHAPDVNYIGEPLFYGMSGSLGPRSGNFILQSADFILVLGNSLCTSQTGFNVKGFAPNAKIVMVDIQCDEAKKPDLHVDLCIEADLKSFFEVCNSRNETILAKECWIKHCEYVYKSFPRFEAAERLRNLESTSRVHSSTFWEKLSVSLEDNAVIALGNSSCVHSMQQSGIIGPLQRIIVNFNSGSMGDDLPEAIGVAVSRNMPVYCITGDGSVMMNLQELQTIYHHQFPIKIVVFSNDGYDNIKNTYKTHFNGIGNGCASDNGISFPSFEKIAAAFKIDYFHIKCIANLDLGIEWLVRHNAPCIVEVDEIMNKLRAPVITSIMNEKGEFFTPPLHIMSPLMDDNEIKKYLIGEKENEQ